MQDSLKILESVNNFYNQSFSQLINITVAVLAFAGIVLPILITFYQKRLFNLEHQAIEKSMQDKLNSEVEKAISKIKAEYEEKEKNYEDKISEIKKELQEQVFNAQGGIFHVQANNDLKQNLYMSALNILSGHP